MVTATVDDDKLAGEVLKVPYSICTEIRDKTEYILQVPYSVQDEIREKTSTSADFREGVIEYYRQYSPQATWGQLAGQLYLYYRECEALAAARRFIKRTPGKCVYIIL